MISHTAQQIAQAVALLKRICFVHFFVNKALCMIYRSRFCALFTLTFSPVTFSVAFPVTFCAIGCSLEIPLFSAFSAHAKSKNLISTAVFHSIISLPPAFYEGFRFYSWSLFRIFILFYVYSFTVFKKYAPFCFTRPR